MRHEDTRSLIYLIAGHAGVDHRTAGKWVNDGTLPRGFAGERILAAARKLGVIDDDAPAGLKERTYSPRPRTDAAAAHDRLLAMRGRK